MEHPPLCSPVSSSLPRLDPKSILLPLASDSPKIQIWLLSSWKLVVLLVKCKFLSMCDVVPPCLCLVPNMPSKLWLQPVSETQFWLFLLHLPLPNSGAEYEMPYPCQVPPWSQGLSYLPVYWSVLPHSVSPWREGPGLSYLLWFVHHLVPGTW